MPILVLRARVSHEFRVSLQFLPCAPVPPIHPVPRSCSPGMVSPTFVLPCLHTFVITDVDHLPPRVSVQPNQPCAAKFLSRSSVRQYRREQCASIPPRALILPHPPPDTHLPHLRPSARTTTPSTVPTHPIGCLQAFPAFCSRRHPELRSPATPNPPPAKVALDQPKDHTKNAWGQPANKPVSYRTCLFPLGYNSCTTVFVTCAFKIVRPLRSIVVLRLCCLLSYIKTHAQAPYPQRN